MNESELNNKIIEIISESTNIIVKRFNLDAEETNYLISKIFEVLIELDWRKKGEIIKGRNVSFD